MHSRLIGACCGSGCCLAGGARIAASSSAVGVTSTLSVSVSVSDGLRGVVWPSCVFWWICSRGALILALVVRVKRVRNGWALVPVCGWVRKQSRARLSFDSVAFDMATALQIAIAQGLDINDIEGGAAKVAALAAEAEREAMVLKAKVRV